MVVEGYRGLSHIVLDSQRHNELWHIIEQKMDKTEVDPRFVERPKRLVKIGPTAAALVAVLILVAGLPKIVQNKLSDSSKHATPQTASKNATKEAQTMEGTFKGLRNAVGHLSFKAVAPSYLPEHYDYLDAVLLQHSDGSQQLMLSASNPLNHGQHFVLNEFPNPSGIMPAGLLKANSTSVLTVDGVPVKVMEFPPSGKKYLFNYKGMFYELTSALNTNQDNQKIISSIILNGKVLN